MPALQAREDASHELAVESLPSEQEDRQSGPVHYELFTYPADFTLEVLDQKWRNGEITIPPIQRRFVWSQYQASRLIESFLLGLPVPGIFMYVERGSERLLVVDGQQRLRSVFYFFSEAFGEEQDGKKTVFRLTLPEDSRWNGKRHSDLREEDARRLKNSVLRAFIMKQVSPEDDTSIYHVFERLNTGGTLLTPQEVRNCVYDGALNQLLHRLNTNPAWRTIVGQPEPDRRLRDIELLLRFLALFQDLPSYQKPMKEFMNKFMKKHRGGEANSELEAVFVRVAGEVQERLGERPFHFGRGLNAPVFDAVFVAFALRRVAIPDDIRTRYEQLLGDSEFQKFTSRATTDVDAVKTRIQKASDLLFAAG
jgi:hypothetical protein